MKKPANLQNDEHAVHKSSACALTNIQRDANTMLIFISHIIHVCWTCVRKTLDVREVFLIFTLKLSHTDDARFMRSTGSKHVRVEKLDLHNFFQRSQRIRDYLHTKKQSTKCNVRWTNARPTIDIR